MIATADTPLVDFYEHIFRVEQLAGRNPRNICDYPRAIEWMSMTLGRESKIGDLSASSIRRTEQRLRDCGNSALYAEKIKVRLCGIWRYAGKIGLVQNYRSMPMGEVRSERMKFLDSPPPADSVSAFYVTHRKLQLSPQGKKDADAAVRNLDKFLGRYALLAEVTDNLLLEFVRWVTKQGKHLTRLSRYPAAIRSIVRLWDPARFPIYPNAAETLPEPAENTVRWFFENVYVPQRMIDATPGAIGQSRYAFRRLRKHYGRDITLAELDDALAADHLSWLKQTKLKASSINGSHRSAIFAAWRFAVELGLKDRDPRIRKLKELHHEPDSWDIIDVQKMLAAMSIYAGKEWPGRVPQEAFWRALFLVTWWTALRIGSLLKLRREHVNLESGWLYVVPESVKNSRGKKYRLGDDAIEAVKAIWEPRRELLFEWPYSKAAIWEHFRAIQKAAGVPDSVLYTQRFHKLRRTVATQAAVHAGMPAAIALLDHSGPEITKRYLDPSKMPGCDATEFLPMLNIALDPRKEVAP